MDDEELAAAVSAAARALNRPMSLEETLQTIVETARIAVPGVDHVGVSTPDRHGNVVTRATTDELVYRLDQLQYQYDEGPCVETLKDATVVLAPRIAQDRRWPRYVPPAVELGLKAQVAVRLYLDGKGTVGGLNMYSTRNEDIDPDARVMADLFATQAALVLGKVREITGLQEALRTRETIGKAIGLTMSKFDLTDEAAFAFLARTSSHSNTKVRNIAEEILDQHNASVTAGRTSDRSTENRRST